MQGYLSDVTARWLLMELARTTLLVAVLGAAMWLVLRLARVSSPTLHRVCCVMVLLAGWTLMRWPVDVAWYEAPPTPVVALAAEPIEEPESFTPPIDPKLLSPPPEFGAGMAAPALAAPEVEAATTEPQFARLPNPMPEVTPQPAWQIVWEQLAVAVWLIGIVAVVGWWLVGYLRFLSQMPRGLDCSPDWQEEFAAACVGQGRAGRVEFRVTEDAGPLLCRLPRRTVLLVPRGLWSALDAVERRAILRHELEHLSRGDLWKSLAVRVLALPHWFNPAAWLAVRRFDDAAEWACDRAAMDEQPTAYAAMLLRLGELAGTRARFGSAMSNRPLTTRIRRLLTLNGTEDSAMKKACLISLLMLVVPLALVRVNLVAEEPEQEAARDQAELAQETPKPANDLGDGFLGFPTEEQMKAAAAENVTPAEPLRDAEPETPVKAAQRKMVEFAKKTYEAQDAAYKAGTITLDQLFHWSNLWLTAELAIAESREEQIAAAQRNLARLKVVEANIRRLYEQGSRGGEQNAMSAANYHVADAERRLAEIEAMPDRQVEAGRPAANREMVDAAKRAFDATKFAYDSGKTTLEPLIAWSFRWLNAELAVAPSREEQLKAARANVDRIRKIHTAIAAMFQTGGGNAQEMETANYYLADAERRLFEIEDLPQQPRASANQRQPRRPLQVAADERQQLLDPGVTYEPLQAQPSPPVAPYATPVPAARPQEPPLLIPLGKKAFKPDDPALPEALRSVLQSNRSAEELLQAMSAVHHYIARTDGSFQEIRFPEVAPELVQLLGHTEPSIRDRAEMALLSIRSSVEDELEKGAKSKNVEIAKRAQRLLKQSEPQVPSPPPRGPVRLLSQQGQPRVPVPVPASSAKFPAASQQAPASPPSGSQQPAQQAPSAVAPRGITGQPQAAGGTYEDRTFPQWVEIFTTELEPDSRKLSLAALRVFAVNGHGKEVAELLISTLGPMMPDVGLISDDEKSLNDDDRNALEDQDEELMSLLALSASTLRRVPRDELLPIISKTLESGNDADRRYVLFAITDPDLLPQYLKLMRDRDRSVAWIAMLRATTLAPRVVSQLLEKSIASSQREERLWAIKTITGVVKTHDFQEHLCKPLVHLIGGDDQELSNAAFHAALKIGSKARPALEEAMKSAEGLAASQIDELLREIPAVPQQFTAPSVQPKFADLSAPTERGSVPEAQPVPNYVRGVVTKRPRYYNGKSFEQWRDALQSDLSPVLRTEAIYAMGEFAEHGYGEETTQILFDTMRDYSVWTLGEASPDGNMKNAAIAAAQKIPTAELLPGIIAALDSGNKNQKLFALRIIPEDATKADLVPLLEAAVSGLDQEVAELAEAPLATLDHDNPVLIDAIHRKLESNQEHQVQQALYMVRGAVSGRIRPYPELLPMALGLLDHADSAIQLVAIDTLGSQAPAYGHTEYIEALKKIASSGDGAATANARKMLERLSPKAIDRRR